MSAVVGNAMRDLRKEFIFWVKGNKLPLHPLLHLLYTLSGVVTNKKIFWVGTGRHDFNTTKNNYIWIGVLAEDDIVPKKLSSEKQ